MTRLPYSKVGLGRNMVEGTKLRPETPLSPTEDNGLKEDGSLRCDPRYFGPRYGSSTMALHSKQRTLPVFFLLLVSTSSTMRL